MVVGKDDRGRTYPELGPSCQAQSSGGLIPDDNVVASGDIPQDICHDEFLRGFTEQALVNLGYSDAVVDRYEPLPGSREISQGSRVRTMAVFPSSLPAISSNGLTAESSTSITREFFSSMKLLSICWPIVRMPYNFSKV